MPPIKEISFQDGVKIMGDGIPSVDITVAQFPSTGNLASRQANLNKLIQDYYEDKKLLSDFPLDDPVRQNPPILLPRERIEKIAGKDYLITTLMFVKVIIYSLNPLKYNIRCSDDPISDSEDF